MDVSALQDDEKIKDYSFWKRTTSGSDLCILFWTFGSFMIIVYIP